MVKFVDNSIYKTKYELFAINFKFGQKDNYTHQICQIKINEKWYEIDDAYSGKKKSDYYENICGLFYKKKN